MIKTHSIVSEECELRPNHIGMPVTYKGVTGWLIRYITNCEHHLISLTMTEVRECIELNTPEDEDILYE
tara:strand:+ start:6811 stop:7017 length:207 start_codon:yes stop_codon:yes gene_type:complete